jgi:hypothetical protein
MIRHALIMQRLHRAEALSWSHSGRPLYVRVGRVSERLLGSIGVKVRRKSPDTGLYFAYAPSLTHSQSIRGHLLVSRRAIATGLAIRPTRHASNILGHRIQRNLVQQLARV